MVKIKFLDGRLQIPEDSSPSGELHMHYLLLKDYPKTRAVLHVHSTHVVAAMYRGFDLPKLCDQFQEIHRRTRVGSSVPFLPPISTQFGEATAIALGVSEANPSGQYDIVGQANHGVCAIASDPWSAYEHIERLDHICEIALKSGVSP